MKIREDGDGFRLVACDRKGDPVEPVVVPPAIAELCSATSSLLERLGHVVPWTGYVAIASGEVVGVGAFVGPPKAGRVEIAYFTLPEHEGKGFATQTARHLVDIARTSPIPVEIVAKTMPEANASTRILERLGFDMVGVETDDDIGEAWGWLLRS
jgi:[ribosomal protein S5]-alanine N-acetyltransferase